MTWRSAKKILLKTSANFNVLLLPFTTVVLVVPWFGVGLVNKVNSAFHPYGVGKSSIGLHGWG